MGIRSAGLYQTQADEHTHPLFLRLQRSSSQGKRKGSTIMTTRSGQTPAQDRTDPIIEALIKELIETTSHPKATSRTEDAITAALLEASMASLTSSERTESQASLETAVFAAALAPALAEALAPVLAEALTPALVKALNEILSAKKTAQEPAPKKGSTKQEGD